MTRQESSTIHYLQVRLALFGYILKVGKIEIRIPTIMHGHRISLLKHIWYYSLLNLFQTWYQVKKLYLQVEMLITNQTRCNNYSHHILYLENKGEGHGNGLENRRPFIRKALRLMHNANGTVRSEKGAIWCDILILK